LLVTGLVAVGVAAAWCMLASWFVGVVESALESREPYENVYMTVDGTPVIVRTSSSGQTTEQILTIDGEPTKLISQDLLHAAAIAGPDSGHVARALEWQKRLSAANDGGVPPTYWYMVHDGQTPGHAYGVGFHAPTKTITGYFGRRGFTETLPPRDDWFDIAGQNGMISMTTAHFYGQEPRYAGMTPRFLLLADGKLWKVDLAQKQLKPLLDCPQDYRVGQVWRILEKPPTPTSADVERQSASSVTPVHALVREPEGVVVVNPQSGEPTRYLLPAHLRDHTLSGAVLPDGNLAAVMQHSWRDENLQIVWLNPAGEITKQQAVRIKSRGNELSVTKLGWQAALATPLPLANWFFTASTPWMVMDYEEANEYGPALGIVLARTWPSILVVVAIGCAMAVLAYRRQRKFGLPNPAVWAAFAFLFGIPGWIAYRFHRTWPAMEDCPACRQPAPRDRNNCLDCGAAFPTPPLKGIEVFAS